MLLIPEADARSWFSWDFLDAPASLSEGNHEMPWPPAVGGFRLGNLQEVGPMAKRTTHRSSSGKKLYAVRDASGRFKDIQTYERAHRADLKKVSKGEAKTAKKR